MPKGKFIVIDGPDGSGKTTQFNLLVSHLKKIGRPVETADFPRYGQKSAGLVEEYLGGKYGSSEEVGPYNCSIFYAVDRYDASFKIRDWLEQGKIVVSNRYVAANMGHQGGKIKDPVDRKKYFDWLYHLEYEIFKIPKPDLNIILHVKAEIAQKLTKHRNRQDWAGKTQDVHEDNLNHLKAAEQVYLEIAKIFPDFTLIECVKNDKIMTPEEIQELVWQEIEPLLSKNQTSINF